MNSDIDHEELSADFMRYALITDKFGTPSNKELVSSHIGKITDPYNKALFLINTNPGIAMMYNGNPKKLAVDIKKIASEELLRKTLSEEVNSVMTNSNRYAVLNSKGSKSNFTKE